MTRGDLENYVIICFLFDYLLKKCCNMLVLRGGRVVVLGAWWCLVLGGVSWRLLVVLGDIDRLDRIDNRFETEH